MNQHELLAELERRKAEQAKVIERELAKRRFANFLAAKYADHEDRYRHIDDTVFRNEWITGRGFMPHPKQLQFLACYDTREVFFGGAGFGGKSQAIWFAALQYVNVPGYSALILRRTYADLAKSGALMDRSRQYLAGTSAVWNERDKKWTFPSGATITFGYLQNENDKYQYAGGEYQFIAFDELTHFLESQYTFLFTRLRRIKGGELGKVPLRMRSASNPGGVGHCVPHGEVLTPHGWKDIRDFAVGDEVYGVAKDGSLVATKVDQVHRSDYKGDLIYANARGLSITCTPNHKVAKLGGVKGSRDAKFSLVPFDELPGQANILRSVVWHGEEIVSHTVENKESRNAKLKQPLTISGNDYCELMGWYLSEGCCLTQKTQARFDIAQIKDRGREKIARMLDRIGFKYKAYDATFSVYSRSWAEYLSRFGKCRDKYVPENIKNATPPQLSLFFRAAMDGDGHWSTDDSGQYYTTSRQLADDMAEIAVKLGYVVYISQRERDNRKGMSYCVSFKRVKSGGTELLTGQHKYNVATTTKRRSDISRTTFSGMVYCIGVPEHHAFVIRQNGSVWVSGNSWVQGRFINQQTRNPDVVFIPSLMQDNPSGDIDEYQESLRAVDPLLRRRMEEGDWSAVEGGRFKTEWLRKYWQWEPDGCHIRLVDERGKYLFNLRQAGVYATCDPASSANQTADYTVFGVWANTPRGDLIWVDCIRRQVDIPDQPKLLQEVYAKHKFRFIGIEAVASNRSMYQFAQRLCMQPEQLTPKGKDKLTRAHGAILLAEQGGLWLPAPGTVSGFPHQDIEAELTSFTGTNDDQHDDVADALSYAVEMRLRLGYTNGVTPPAGLGDRPGWYDSRTQNRRLPF